MHVLLDEHLDWRLTQDFDSDFQVSTVRRQNWSGKQNGELLRLASTKFDSLVTMDKGIEHQQNLSQYPLSIIIISARSNLLSDIQPARYVESKSSTKNSSTRSGHPCGCPGPLACDSHRKLALDSPGICQHSAPALVSSLFAASQFVSGTLTDGLKHECGKSLWVNR